jgi:hypothetical protein
MLMKVFLLSSCGTPEHRFRKFSPAPDSVERIPMTLALVLPPSVCSYAHPVGDIRPSVFHVGETICRNIKEAANLNFKTVKLFGKTDAARTEDADALLVIEMIGVKHYQQRKVPLVIGYQTLIEWSFTTKDGKSRYVQKLTGNGEDERTFGYVHPRHRDSLQRCLDDLGRKVYEEMTASLEKGRKNLETQKDILTKFGKYQIGKTTHEIYVKDQTEDWNVNILQRVSRSKKFEDNTTEMEVYLKDMVHSAYGESLACELEFQGKGGKSNEVFLSSIICKMDDELVISKGNRLIK